MEARKHRKCKHCGKEFDASADSVKFVKTCPACKEMYKYGEPTKKALEEMRAAEETPTTTKRYTLSQLIRMASERGISYGQLSRELNL